MFSKIASLDSSLLAFMNRYAPYVARVGLFVVYFWFGILKILDTSPANPLVNSLLQRTLPFITFHDFIIFFSLFEMTIGVLFIIPKMERLAFALLVPHMVMTVLPLLFLPQITWQTFLTPTLEGQYIIKNLLIIASAMLVVGSAKPLAKNA